MGTRHLIAVWKDGQYRVAQYCQWDGYPEGAGKDVLDFLSRISPATLSTAVNKCFFYLEDEVEKFSIKTADWFIERPWLSRGAGAKILDYVCTSPNGIKLVDNHDFGLDGLFCEFAYVIDLDRKMLEFYQGLFTTPPKEGERFYNNGEPSTEGRAYYPVHLLGEWPLDALPSVQELIELSDANEEKE